MPSTGDSRCPVNAPAAASRSAGGERFKTDAAKPTRIQIGGSVQMAKVVHCVEPVYPRDARIAHILAAVTLQVVVATDGTVLTAEYVAGPPIFEDAAMDAVEKWQFEPKLLEGQPVEVDTRIYGVFALKSQQRLRLTARLGYPQDIPYPLASFPEREVDAGRKDYVV
jgi:TonB family protein